MVRADEPSCVRTIVSVSVEMAETRTNSEFALVGLAPVGHTVAIRPTANFVPSPDCTTNDVPLLAGLGAVATVE